MSDAPEMKIRALAPWFGGKRTLAPRIVKELCGPKTPKSYWDLLCGGLAVTMEMPRCSHMTVNDLHGDLVNMARTLQDPVAGAKLYRRLRRTLAAESLFYEAKEKMASSRAGESMFGGHEELSADDRAYCFFVLSWLGRNGVAGTERVNYQPAVRWTSGGGHSGVRFASAVDSIPSWRRRLRELTILSRDVFDVVHRIEDQDGTAIYADPPYWRGGARTGGAAYEHEFTETQHSRLASALRRFTKSRVVVSYYDDPAIRELYKDWTFVDCSMQKNLHVQNRRGVGRCDAPELLIVNGPSFTDGNA